MLKQASEALKLMWAYESVTVESLEFQDSGNQKIDFEALKTDISRSEIVSVSLSGCDIRTFKQSNGDYIDFKNVPYSAIKELN